ncbi:unnamed protein product [Adineta ricciae]|uniref:CUB domain-containing protein n=1 Tax=Adineta ricciae TaxID=249248 RepID=A0A815Y3C5_ADIRI|nr:unnamed protein product [Adineta ricciae]CAF1564827.1 unnamed protein product [Adineta ricciae]
MCEPDVHSDYLVHCQGSIDGSLCEGNKTCFIEVSSRNYIQCSGGTYAPTYFFVKYTCTQIHTMCVDNEPIRNTLYGFIVSPAYPHPMADNLKCSINIEADPSMYIELSPVHISLLDTYKCRSDYLEIFGYLNSISTNLPSDKSNAERNSLPVWKSYHTWCGADRSPYNPTPNTRYLISSNSLYMSLQTSASKRPRYFKIRYKVVPSIARAQYDADGIAMDSSSEPSISSVMTGTTAATIPLTTIVVPTVEENTNRTSNETTAKRTYKREIIIGTIAGVFVLVIAILVGVGIFLFIKRRQTRAPGTKSTTSAAAASSGTNAGKKNASSPSSLNSTALKPGAKSSDKAPLLQQTAATTTTNISKPTPAPAAKPKLIPERTVNLSDVNTSRFKSHTMSTTTAPAATTAASGLSTTVKDTTSGHTEAVATASAPAVLKPALTVADSGIYGADFSDDPPSVVTKPIEPTKIYGIDLPDKSENNPPASSLPIPLTVVVNPLSDGSSSTPANTTTSPIVIPNHISMNSLAEEREGLLTPLLQNEHLDETVKSAYLSLIDATMSENEGTVCGGSLVSSASQSRRTSNVKQPLLSHEPNNFEGISRKTTQFNPLHVILKKDANKYYTTEYI